MTAAYIALEASRRSEIPPSLPTWRGKCDQCGDAIIGYLPSLEKNRAMYERLGRVMRVYCPACGEQLLAEQGGIEIIQVSPGLAKHFNRG